MEEVKMEAGLYYSPDGRWLYEINGVRPFFEGIFLPITSGQPIYKLNLFCDFMEKRHYISIRAIKLTPGQIRKFWEIFDYSFNVVENQEVPFIFSDN